MREQLHYFLGNKSAIPFPRMKEQADKLDVQASQLDDGGTYGSAVFEVCLGKPLANSTEHPDAHYSEVRKTLLR
jgi:mannitol/fructose-specific phosphotransferase system IIA component